MFYSLCHSNNEAEEKKWMRTIRSILKYQEMDNFRVTEYITSQAGRDSRLILGLLMVRTTTQRGNQFSCGNELKSHSQ